MQDLAKMMYVLVETEDTGGISSPLKTTNRIKFLSFAVSDIFIVFGATSGGLYVYDRETFTFISLVPNKEGPVSCVRISPDGKWFGFSTARGISCAIEHSGSSVNRRILSHEHEGFQVTAMEWNNLSNQLYVGDNSGRISVISVASYLTPAVALMQLDSSIVQLDSCSYMLLASTKTRSYLCDTFREQYRQIGTRMRDGDFGACFYKVNSSETYCDPLQDVTLNVKDSHGPFSSLADGEWLLSDKHLQNIKLFCARPGLRLWEVRVDGAVMSTHQFKQLLSTPPVSVIHPPSLGTSLGDIQEVLVQEHHFTKILKMSNQFLLTYDQNGLFVLDPMTSEVILWTDQFKNIMDVCVVGEVIYLWMGDCKLHAVSLLPIDKFLVRIYFQKQYLYCAQMCATYLDTLKRLAHDSMKMHVLSDLLERIKEEEKDIFLDDSVIGKTKELLEEVSKNARNQKQAQMLNSGIFIVGNAHMLSQKEGMRMPYSHNSVKSQPNDLKISNLPDFEPRPHVENDSMNSLFSKFVPSILSPALITEQTDGNSDDDYDPFPDLPLSSLTSAETVMALKNLTTTVSGTISNGTKSLKEKWQSFEEKLRGQEERGLSVEMSINRPDAETRNKCAFEGNEEENSATKSSTIYPKLITSYFEESCRRIFVHDPKSGTSFEDQQLEMLNSFADMYVKFVHMVGHEREETLSSLIPKGEAINNFAKVLNQNDIAPFPFANYFDKKFFATLSCHFSDNLKSGILTKWLVQFSSMINLNQQLFPSHIICNQSEDSLKLDQTLGQILKIFSDLLDPHSILQSLNSSNIPCHYFSWNVIMNHFHRCPTVTSDDKNSLTWPLPRKLNAMSVMFQLGQVESCRNLGEEIPVKHVLRTVLRLECADSNQKFKLFLLYLEKMIEHKLAEELQDSEIYDFTLLSFVSLVKTDAASQCECGYPFHELNFQKSFNNVGQTLLSHIYKTNGLPEALAFCQKTGVLWYHLLTLRRSEKVDEVLPLIIQVACEEELKERCSEFSSTTWELMFHLRCRLQLGYCLQCNRKFSEKSPSKVILWTTLALLLIQETNMDFALALLSKFSDSIPSGKLNIKFYQSCLLASVAEIQNVDLKRNLFDAFADYKTVPVMSSKLAAGLGLPGSHSQHHWGVKLQLLKSHCLCCMLSLASKSGGSVVTFHCCHSFHSVCLQQRMLRQCPICVT